MFVFYDLETTGLSPAWDQILQFAAIRTDKHMHVVEEVNIRSRLAPHILPSPAALNVTGVRPDRLNDPNLPNAFTFAQNLADQIRRWTPGIWIGFNSMRFDEGFLRQAFYQNLHPDVYATQMNGNCRLDLLTAVYAAHTRESGAVVVPVNGQGRPTFSLAGLASANGFEGHEAHDALGDVKAALHIARRIRERRPALWADLLTNVRKHRVVRKLADFRPVEVVCRPGSGVPRAFFGCLCGWSECNRSEAAVVDLDAADPETLFSADDDTLLAAITGEPRTIHPVAVNRAPAIFELTCPKPEHARKAEAIASAPEFRRRVGQALAARWPAVPEAQKPVEERIYESFYSRDDQQLLRRFQIARWPERREIQATLNDDRLRKLGHRLIAAYSPEPSASKNRSPF